MTELTGKSFPFVEADVRDRAALDALFRAHDVDAVIHFAGLKAVGESVEKPLLYWDNNVCGTVILLEAMAAAGVKTLVFSSSATVYGDPATVPIREDFPVGVPTNPYGRSKLVVEQVLTDLAAADPAWRIALLRYFNPVGAHESGRLGEDPRGIPNNLMPYVSQVAVGRREALNVFGDDYPTPDGTGVRDYLHVVDLAVGHVKAVEKLGEGPGSGSGTSARAGAAACWRSCAPSRRPRAARSPTGSSPGGRATSRSAGRTRRRPSGSSAGRRCAAWTRCARTAGGGRRRTRTVSTARTEERGQEDSLILVTGGAGFIGVNFVLEWMALSGEPVVNLDKLTYAGNPRSLAAAGEGRAATSSSTATSATGPSSASSSPGTGPGRS